MGPSVQNANGRQGVVGARGRIQTVTRSLARSGSIDQSPILVLDIVDATFSCSLLIKKTLLSSKLDRLGSCLRWSDHFTNLKVSAIGLSRTGKRDSGRFTI